MFFYVSTQALIDKITTKRGQALLILEGKLVEDKYEETIEENDSCAYSNCICTTILTIWV